MPEYITQMSEIEARREKTFSNELGERICAFTPENKP